MTTLGICGIVSDIVMRIVLRYESAPLMMISDGTRERVFLC